MAEVAATAFVFLLVAQIVGTVTYLVLIARLLSHLKVAHNAG
jgi:hypothetical protein